MNTSIKTKIFTYDTDVDESQSVHTFDEQCNGIDISTSMCIPARI